MSSNLDAIIQLGHDILTHKYYGFSSSALLFYDYLLTLADEIRYAWSGQKSWTFWLFILNRYFPMTLQLWRLVVDQNPHYNLAVCKRSSWYTLFAFFVCTLIAQVVLTLRIYAVTSKNAIIAIGFATITVSQVGLGIFMFVRTIEMGVEQFPPIPLDAYRFCVFAQDRPAEVAYTGISLFFDSLAFLCIIFFSKKSKGRGPKVSTILDTISEDATCYFSVIFTSHLVFVLTLNLGRPGIQLIPGSGILVYLPLMISRIMLSLRKAADPSKDVWTLVGPAPNTSQVKYHYPRRSTTQGRDEDDITLNTFNEP